MFKRKIFSEYENWYNSLTRKKKALIVKGARQVGKTTSVIEFAKTKYDNVVYINFKTTPSHKIIFDGDYDVDSLIMNISARVFNAYLIPYKTVIILDEIQECANARAAIKPFMEDGRFDVIATGSLLGIRGYNKKKNEGVSTGFERTIMMHSMDFEEFLWALGIGKNITDAVRYSFYNKEKIDNALNDILFKYFRQYICVGGMPEVVDTFIKTKNLAEVYNVQNDILENYKDDFAKHLDENEKEEVDLKLLVKIMEVFDSIPSQLAKENKKFQFSKLKSNARSSEYESAIEWLKDAGIISLCYNLTNLELPLDGNKNDSCFKIYMQDTGLFVSTLEKGTAGNILSGDLGIYKGAIYENIIADAFIKNEKKLYYFSKSSGLEIDFVTRYDNECVLVEVKANNNKAKSAKTIIQDKTHYNINKCIKFANSNVGNSDGIYTYPLYMAYLLVDEFNEII